MKPISDPATPSVLGDPHAILESMGDAFYALDGEWRIVYANRKALDFWKTTADDVLGRVVWERLPELVGTLNEDALRQARVEQRAITFEAPSPVTGVHVSVTVGPSADGVCVYWRDITERIMAAETLRRSEEHPRLAQKAGGIGTWEWDLQTDRIVRPDGEIRWPAGHGTLLRSSDSRSGRVIGVLQDITERKRTEERLRESEARLEMATEAAGIGIWNLLDSTMRYSELAKAIRGFPANQPVTYEMVRDVTHPEDFPRTSALARRALDPAIREVPVYEYRLLLPDGQVRWVTASGQVVFAEMDGKPISGEQLADRVAALMETSRARQDQLC